MLPMQGPGQGSYISQATAKTRHGQKKKRHPCFKKSKQEATKL